MGDRGKMRKTYKSVFCLCAVLVFCLSFIPVTAFAQDPFTSIAVGGLNGASGAGLFGSMASASGVNIGYTSDPVNDAMWNKLNPDSVYFTGEKHEADPLTDPDDIYDYIQVDIGDWLDAQSDFIINYIQTNNVQDNSSGVVPVTDAWRGIQLPFAHRVFKTSKKSGTHQPVVKLPVGILTFAEP